VNRAGTIFAIASGAGRAGVAVVRLSGPEAGAALVALSGLPLPAPRRASLRRLSDPADGRLLDQALVLWFPAPGSFTGEDVAELHIHGGVAIAAAVTGALARLPGVRLAEPGEFTRRAFEHDKLDLTQAEALADLIDAETEAQHRQALAQFEGALSAALSDWRARLLTALALLEAEIDFPDEDLPGGLSARVAPMLARLAADIGAALADAGRYERVREGYRVAILGAPNAGKSSLLNALVGRDAAIVSDIPGTTRDVVEVRLVLAGYPVWIADTAGLREAADAVEAEGVRRALARAEEADLRLWVIDATSPQALPPAAQPGDLVIWNKVDVAGGGSAPPPAPPPGVGWNGSGHADHNTSPIPLCARTGEGVADLLVTLTARVTTALAQRDAPALTRLRHRQLLSDAARDLSTAQHHIDDQVELAAEQVRRAAEALAKVTGRIDIEEVLGEIFASFCIGK
jgi:tRNA modification GTPase